MLQFKKISARLGLIAALIAVLLLMMIANAQPASASPHPIHHGKVALATEESTDGLDLGGDDSSNSGSDQNSDEEPTATKSKKKATPTEEVATPEVPDISEDVDLTDDPNDVIDALRKNDVLHTKRDGKLLFTIPPNGATFLRTADPGYTIVILGRNKTSERFVMFSTIEWTDAGKNSECGIGFRWHKDIVSYMSLSNDGLIYAASEADNDTTDSIKIEDQDQEYFDPEKVNTVLLIGDQDDVDIYVNHRFVGTLKAEPQDGTFMTLLWNDKGNRKRTYCIYQKGWVWAFDN